MLSKLWKGRAPSCFEPRTPALSSVWRSLIRDQGLLRRSLQHYSNSVFSSKKGRVSMGMGLPVARRIIGRPGGSLTVSSHLGEGTTFAISMPVAV